MRVCERECSSFCISVVDQYNPEVSFDLAIVLPPPTKLEVNL